MATNLRVDVGGIPLKSLSRLFIGRPGVREGRKFDIIYLHKMVFQNSLCALRVKLWAPWWLNIKPLRITKDNAKELKVLNINQPTKAKNQILCRKF